ncbi:MAG: AbrB/MazE/SpoVT family DNA-binding domain-containing protein [Candidatus Woesearchaeota archaeon]|jgi:phosphate uptake regulator
MKRTLIKQGGHGLTFYVPKKWADEKGLKAGDELDVTVEPDQLILKLENVTKQPKKTEITVDSNNFHVYRSIIGGLYRAGYDEIVVTFKDRKVIPVIQHTLNSLYGFEMFDIDENSCTLRSIYNEEATDIKIHVVKMMHIVKTMQSILMEDLNNKQYDEKNEMFEYRNNVLKQRDLIARIIIKNQLTETKQFSYYTIAFSLWNVARNYYQLYNQLDIKTEYSKKNILFFEEVNSFFDHIMKLDRPILLGLQEKRPTYDLLRQQGIDIIKNKKETSVIALYGVMILMAIQSADSSILMINS